MIHQRRYRRHHYYEPDEKQQVARQSPRAPLLHLVEHHDETCSVLSGGRCDCGIEQVGQENAT